MSTQLRSLTFKCDEMTDDIRGIRECCATLQIQIKDLREECVGVREANTNLREKNVQLEKRVEDVEKKAGDLEYRSKRNSAGIHGLQGGPGREVADCLPSVVWELVTDKLELVSDSPFDRLHRLNKGSSSLGCQAACNADNLPAHFKHRSELPVPPPSTPPLPPPPPASFSSTSSSTSSSSAAASTSVTTVTAVTASSSSPSSSSSAVKTVSAVTQSVVLVPGSPPQTPRASHDNTALPAPLPSRLAQLRQSNLAKKREQMKTMKMPELSEHAESSSESEMPVQEPTTTTTSNGAPSSSSSPGSRPYSSSSSAPRKKFASAPQVSVTCVDDDGGGGGDGVTTNGEGDEEVLSPPSPTGDPVTPSIPESFLKAMGLLSSARKDADKDKEEDKEEEQVNGGEPSVDQLPDKQLESRFNSLALAFKTDRLTLDRRLNIQERSRDIAEQNIDKELQGLRDAVEIMKQLCEDVRVQEVISKIQHHLDILEHSVARVSSRAEVFGAVQQEQRMCLAMEVMIRYTENIQRLRSKEMSEVEEARKVLTTTRQSNFSLDTFGIGDRRSASVCAGLNNPRTGRRRSEVALPRFFGGTGTPSLHMNPSMESGFLSELSQSTVGMTPRASFAAESLEEPRQRFQSATANITVRNVVTNTLRRASLERHKSLTVQSSSSCSSASVSNAPTVSFKDDLVDKSLSEESARQHSQEEEAYRHGYEEGLKASLSRELTDLRDQQTTISSSLEHVMDRVDSFNNLEDNQQSDIEEAVSRVKEAVVKARTWMSNPSWQSASHLLRVTGAALFFVLALVVAVLTLAPLVPSHISIRNHAKSAQ